MYNSIKNIFFNRDNPFFGVQDFDKKWVWRSELNRLFMVVAPFLFSGFISFGQPAPIRLSPFTKSQDSCIRPFRIMDPVFLPKMVEIRPVIGWQWKAGEPTTLPRPEIPFYIMSGLLLFAGITFRTFPKYFDNINRLFFQSGFRQKSIRDQLVQNKTASLAANTLFFFTAGVYLFLLGVKFGVQFPGLWYTGILSCVSLLLIIYLTKYLLLSLGGWVFASQELANQYAFIVFFINKVMGLFLLPVVVILWFGRSSLHPQVIIISYLTLFLLFAYRYFLILPIVRKQSYISPFHFFIYLCTFEIVPILLLIKVLVNFLPKSN